MHLVIIITLFRELAKLLKTLQILAIFKSAKHYLMHIIFQYILHIFTVLQIEFCNTVIGRATSMTHIPGNSPLLEDLANIIGNNFNNQFNKCVVVCFHILHYKTMLYC